MRGRTSSEAREERASQRSGPARGAPSPASLPAGDETYLDIFRDFSLMASDDPEKLSRRSHDLHTL